MSKNLTRKGLALGALVALGTSVIAGAPAQAAETISTTSALGSSTNFTGLFSQSFTLNTLASSTAHVWYKISGPQAQNISESLGASAVVTSTTAATPGVERNEANTAGAAATDTTFIVDGGVNNPATYNKLKLTLSGTAATTDVTVVAWVDVLANASIDPSETSNSTVVKFVKDASVTATTTLTKPILNDANLVAKVTLDNGVNLAVAAPAVSVYFSRNGADATASGVPGDASTYVSADSNLSVTTAASVAVSAATYAAQAYVNSVASGTESIKVAAAGTVNSTGALVPTAGANVVAGADWTVRAGTTSVTLSDTLKKADTTAVAAGVVATVTVTKVGADVTSVFTAGGKTIAANAANGTAISFDLTTDAAGKISFDLGNSAAKDLDSVTVAVTSEGIAGTTKTINWAAAAYSIGANTTAKSIAVGGTYTGTWYVRDQFGVAPADGKYAVTVTRAVNAARTTAASWSYSAPVVGGVATVSVVDNGAGTGSDTVSAGLYNVLTGGGLGTQVGVNTNFVLTYATASSLVPTAVTASNSSSVAVAGGLNLVDYVTTDTSVANAVAGPSYNNGEVLSISVQQITGANIAGIPVTVSAKGLAFFKGSKYTVDSITFTASGGTDTLNVYSNLTGKQTITITAGSVSKTVDITFVAAVASTGKTLTITAPAASLPGRSVPVTVKLVDKYGNPVASGVGGVVTVSVAGVGYTTPIAAATNAAGEITFNVVLSAADAGTVTISASFDAAGTDNDLTKTASIAVAAAEPSAIVNVVGKRVYVKFNDSKGEEVSAVIGGVRITKIATYNGYVISKLAKKGKVTVKAYVAGDLVKASTVTVK